MEKKRKPRTVKLALRMPRKSKAKDAPKSSARPVMQKRSNLTLHYWLTVFAFIDSHLDMSQENVASRLELKVRSISISPLFLAS